MAETVRIAGHSARTPHTPQVPENQTRN